MRQCGIESDENALEVVTRTNAAAVKLSIQLRELRAVLNKHGLLAQGMLPEQIDRVLQGRQAKIAQLRALLEEVVDLSHENTCAAAGINPQRCDCGVEDWNARVHEALKGGEHE